MSALARTADLPGVKFELLTLRGLGSTAAKLKKPLTTEGALPVVARREIDVLG